MTSMTQLNSHEILINIRRSLCRALVVSKEFSHCDWATKTGIMFKELAMQALIINFNLDGITRSDYEGVCNELAPAFAAVPGLISKHWLADEANNTLQVLVAIQRWSMPRPTHLVFWKARLELLEECNNPVSFYRRAICQLYE